jgi:hypothetical protein
MQEQARDSTGLFWRIWGLAGALWLLGGGAWAAAADWPQLQHDPQRTGYTAEEVAPPFKVDWYRNFQPERISRLVQAVVHAGHVFVPSEEGNVYALGETDGQIAWKKALGSPIEHTAACADGRVVVALLDGRIVALGAKTGEDLWTFKPQRRRVNFTAAPCIADGQVFIASRQGILYAISLADGSLLWELNLDVPVYQTAAHDQGVVYIGGEDIRMQAVDGRSGRIIWTSEQFYGQSLKDNHPVVTGGYVLFRPMPVHPSREYFNSNWGKDPAVRADYIFQATWDHYSEWTGFGDRKGPNDVQAKLTPIYQEMRDEVRAGRMPERLMKAQEAVIEHYRNSPYDQTLFVLNQRDGRQAKIVPHFHLFHNNGAPPPPAVCQDGTVIIPWIYCSHVWARLDLNLGRVVEIMLTPGGSNGDETLYASVGGRYFYALHCEETNAAYTGVFDFQTKTWARLPSIEKRWWQLSDNTESGANAGSIANGRLYHIVFHQVAAFSHSDQAPARGRRGQ